MKKTLGYFVLISIPLLMIVVLPIIFFIEWWQFALFYGIIGFSCGASWLITKAIIWINE